MNHKILLVFQGIPRNMKNLTDQKRKKSFVINIQETWGLLVFTNFQFIYIIYYYNLQQTSQKRNSVQRKYFSPNCAMVLFYISLQYSKKGKEGHEQELEF